MNQLMLPSGSLLFAQKEQNNYHNMRDFYSLYICLHTYTVSKIVSLSNMKVYLYLHLHVLGDTVSLKLNYCWSLSLYCIQGNYNTHQCALK